MLEAEIDPAEILGYIPESYLRNSEIENYIIPKGITSIGKYAFYNCSSLTSITIPSSVTSINTNTFAWCKNLTNIEIPNSVTSIGYTAFYDCTSLTSIIYNGSIKEFKAIKKLRGWDSGVPAIDVICTDGVIELW